VAIRLVREGADGLLADQPDRSTVCSHKACFHRGCGVKMDDVHICNLLLMSTVGRNARA